VADDLMTMWKWFISFGAPCYLLLLTINYYAIVGLHEVQK